MYLFFYLFSFFIGYATASENNLIFNTHDSYKIKYFLSTPSTPKAALLILPGNAGYPNSEDGEVESPFVGKAVSGKVSKPSLQIAEALKEEGFASFRFQKRGFANKEELNHQTMDYFISDALAAYKEMVRLFPNIPHGIVGFSEGALLAIYAADQIKTEKPALFLMALPSGSPKDVIEHQFFKFPISLLMKRLDKNNDFVISNDELSEVNSTDLFPLIQKTAKELDLNNDGNLQYESEILPVYKTTYDFIQTLLTSPGPTKDWLSSWESLPRIDLISKRIDNSSYFFVGSEDSQVDVEQMTIDALNFKGFKNIKIYPGLGHCFSEYEGKFKQLKTAGPIDNSVLIDLVNTIKSELHSEKTEK